VKTRVVSALIVLSGYLSPGRHVLRLSSKTTSCFGCKLYSHNISIMCADSVAFPARGAALAAGSIWYLAFVRWSACLFGIHDGLSGVARSCLRGGTE
jgi:hypothetical protein